MVDAGTRQIGRKVFDLLLTASSRRIVPIFMVGRERSVITIAILRIATTIVFPIHILWDDRLPSGACNDDSPGRLHGEASMSRSCFVPSVQLKMFGVALQQVPYVLAVREKREPEP